MLRSFIAALALAGLPAHADLSVFATVPEWAALAQEIGGDKVKVYAATNALQDPHHVEARPSLIARARGADLVVATGAELEVGWLPLVIQQAANPKIRPGQPGYFEATAYVPLLGKPTRLDRADGDVHPAGDPHIQTDPRNIARVAVELASRMAQLDPANASLYQSRHKQFAERWSAALARWEKQATPLKGMPIVVQHKAFTYLEAWLGLREVAALEPKPGAEPTTAHLSSVVEALQRTPAKVVIRAAYQSPRASEWLAQRAKINAVALPFTVGGTEGAKDLFGLFDDTIARLLKAAA
ncbi:MAG: zinc ABC transporter substrate-binding protein [Burkholderiales bacterium]|nr:zinc ABC transporter substrate-binding protein [Burkholderiales bacterium]